MTRKDFLKKLLVAPFALFFAWKYENKDDVRVESSPSSDLIDPASKWNSENADIIADVIRAKETIYKLTGNQPRPSLLEW